jgi:hypothetical protein
MVKKRKLSKRQIAVIDEIFRGEVDEQSILDKYKVSRKLYNRWLADETFSAEFDRRIEAAFRQSAILIARYAPLAAAKLVALTESDKEETARKACLDIISSAFRPKTQDPGLKTQDNEPLATSDKPPGGLSDETASRLLEALAEEE